MMTLEEMKLAVCEKLDRTILYSTLIDYPFVHWPSEGLKVCHEAEKLLSVESGKRFIHCLWRLVAHYKTEVFSDDAAFLLVNATYEQRLEALCRVWFPERFK